MNPPMRAPLAAPLSLRGPIDLRLPEAEDGLGAALRRPVLIGVALVLVFMGGFGAWASLVPIAGGAVAPGIISPDGSRRTVQHLEGGIIAELLVRDGAMVTEGQPLLVLENVQARAALGAFLAQERALLAAQARLRAEQAGLEDFPDPFDPGADAEARLLLDGQRALLATRNAAHLSRRNVLQARIEQALEQMEGIEAQVTSTTAQSALIREELRGKQILLAHGLVPRPEVLRLQRSEAEIEGRRGEFRGRIAQLRQQIGETEMQMLAADAERADKVAEALDKLRTELATVAERLQASRDVLARTVVAAPVSGIVVNLRFRNREAVIRPGEHVLDIVPADEALLIDVRIPPNDIDVVQPGLAAEVRLSAFSSRALPRLWGVVRSVSADRLTEEGNREGYYLARVEVDRASLAELGTGVQLVPGMAAEVLVVRRERTLAQYLIEPVLDAWRRSFREM